MLRDRHPAALCSSPKAGMTVGMPARRLRSERIPQGFPQVKPCVFVEVRVCVDCTRVQKTREPRRVSHAPFWLNEPEESAWRTPETEKKQPIHLIKSHDDRISEMSLSASWGSQFSLNFLYLNLYYEKKKCQEKLFWTRSHQVGAVFSIQGGGQMLRNN